MSTERIFKQLQRFTFMDEQSLAEEFFCAEKVENNRENMKTENYRVIQHQYFGGADAAGPV